MRLLENIQPLSAKVKLAPLVFALAVGLFSSLPAAATPARQEAPDLEIVGVDASDFPAILLTVIAADGEAGDTLDATTLTLLENGRPIDRFTIDRTRAPTDFTFVIDANESILTIDEPEGEPRLEIARAAIDRFLSRWLAPTDRVSIVVPDEQEGRFLVAAGSDVFTIRPALEGYDVDEPAETPLQEMMALVLSRAAEAESGRFQAILLLTDGASLDEQLDFEPLVAEAEAAGVAIYAAILGQRADSNEIANVARLYEPTGGFHTHLTDAEAADAVYQDWQDHALQRQIRYRSRAAASGRQIVSLTWNGASDEAAFQITVEPPVVQFPADARRQLQRTAATADTPLADMVPARFPLMLDLTWPDGHSRRLAEAQLFVNGNRQTLARAPVLSGDSLTLDWSVADLDAGLYTLEVAITDELGLQARSQPVDFEILIEQPAPPTPIPTAAPAVESPSSEPEPALTPLTVRQLARDVALLLGELWAEARAQWPATWPQPSLLGTSALLLVLLLPLMWWRRRRTRRQHTSTGAATPAIAEGAVEPAALAPAYLEVIANAPEHQQPIPLWKENVGLGRDGRRVELVLKNESVSPVHARICRSNGGYRLYDEGSRAGTYHNFQRVRLTPHTLNDGDSIHLGRVHLRFRIIEPAYREGAVDEG